MKEKLRQRAGKVLMSMIMIEWGRVCETRERALEQN
jgi:hypothetical protein